MRHRGFTLLELLIAVSLLAIISILSLRGLDVVLRSRDQITAATGDLQRLSALFAQIDSDLRQVPRSGTALPVFSAEKAGEGVNLHWVRDAAAGNEASQLVHVSWRVRAERLERLMAPAALETVPDEAWQPVLSRVKSIQWREWAGRQWQPVVPRTGASELPMGLEFTLERSDGTRYVRVYATRG